MYRIGHFLQSARGRSWRFWYGYLGTVASVPRKRLNAPIKPLRGLRPRTQGRANSCDFTRPGAKIEIGGRWQGLGLLNCPCSRMPCDGDLFPHQRYFLQPGRLSSRRDCHMRIAVDVHE